MVTIRREMKEVETGRKLAFSDAIKSKSSAEEFDFLTVKII